MKKALILFYIIAAFPIMSFSQEPFIQKFDQYNKEDVTTPEVKGFEKVEFINNDLSTGKLGFSIPVYTITSGRLKYPIELIYNSGGIKIDEQASEVGLGWSLSKTVITRQIVDGNDFDNIGTQQYAGNLVAGSQEYIANSNIGEAYRRMGYFLHKQTGQKPDYHFREIDVMPDIYKMLNSGFNTTFYYRNETTPIELSESKSIITAYKTKVAIDNPRNYVNPQANPQYNFPMYDFTKIEITSNEGIKYTFNNYDVSITTSLNLPMSSNSVLNSFRDYPQISTWHISEIEDLQTGEKINFIYDIISADPIPRYSTDYNNTPGLISSFTYTTKSKKDFIDSFGSCISRNYNQYALDYGTNEVMNINQTFTRHITKSRLKEIVFREGKIKYNWSESDRLDLYSSKSLDNIQILDNFGNLIKSISFDYSYFENVNGDSFKNKRLKLNSVTELGLPPYSFEYYNDDNIPSITCTSKDAFGYYNSNIPNNQFIPETCDQNGPTYDIPSIYKMPSLYFYPNQREYSILPFNIGSITNYKIYGDYELVSDLNSTRLMSLKNITYPTGAKSEIEYELNQFKIFGEVVVGGGLRLKSQKIKDENNTIRNIEYSYIDESGNSSGTIVNPPYFGRPNIYLSAGSGTGAPLSQWDQLKLYDTFDITNEPKIDADIIKGTYILYSRVVDSEIGNGYSVSIYTSNETQSNIFERSGNISQEPLNCFTHISCVNTLLENNSAFGIGYYTDNSYKRGKLLSNKIFNSNSDILKETTFIYEENQSFSSEVFKKRLFQRYSGLLDDACNYYENILDIKKTYKSNTYKLRNKIENDYTSNGTVNITTSFQYNLFGYPSIVSKHLGDDEIKSLSLVYYGDNPSPQDVLFQNNYLSKLISKEESSENNYNQFTLLKTENLLDAGGFVNKVISKKENNDEHQHELVSIDLYENGKPLEISKEGNGKIVYIWGYNDSKIVAKITNATYSDVINYVTQIKNYSNLDNDTCLESENCNENNLRLLLNLLRAVPNLAKSQITTYTYNPLVGLTSVTDSKGDTQYYFYDNLNRLQYVKDKNGNILSENEYHYRPIVE